METDYATQQSLAASQFFTDYEIGESIEAMRQAQEFLVKKGFDIGAIYFEALVTRFFFCASKPEETVVVGHRYSNMNYPVSDVTVSSVLYAWKDGQKLTQLNFEEPLALCKEVFQ